jgi:hypothetical protein
MPTPLTPKAHDPMPPLTAAERILFEAARARIADAAFHAQRFYAADAEGRDVPPTSPKAQCWCGIGSLLATLRVDTITSTPLSQAMVLRFCNTALRLLDDDRIPVTYINDDQLSQAQLPEEWRTLTPHQRILDIYDRVLA